MVYGVIGTGALGGFYGGRLAKSGQEVHFLLHRDYEYVKENGLHVDSCDGSFHLEQVHAYGSAVDMPKCDVVLVGLKTTNNHLLSSLLPPLLRHDTVVVLIQNGIGVEEDVQKMFPGQPLVAGLAFICCSKTEPGRVNHQCYGSINFGNYSCRDERTFRAIIDEFTHAGIECAEVEYLEARWRKAVWNVPFNGMTVVLNTQTDLLLKHPSTRGLIYTMMMEVITAARHLGVTSLDHRFADKMMEMTDNMTPYSPSMKLDYDLQRPMEIKYIYLRPLQIAAEAGCPMPHVDALAKMLSYIGASMDEGKDLDDNSEKR